MKKKAKASGGGGSPQPSSSPAVTGDSLDLEGLKARIHEHSLFFDRLVELIPARYYLPADEDKPWFQGLSKAAKASAKAESRRHIKEARRARLDPSKPSPTTLDLLLQKNSQAEIPSDDDDEDDDDEEEDEEEEDDEEEEEDDEAGSTRSVIKGDRSVTYEELRQRLQCRIQELRAGRNTRPGAIITKLEKKDKKKSKKDKKNKKEGDASTSAGEKRKREDGEATEAAESDKKAKQSWKKKKKNQKDESNAVPTDLSFGQIKMGGEEEGRRKRKKLSKHQELERAIQLEKAKKDPEKGDIVSKQHSWKAAVDRAAGKKVHDDPKLLKESIKREKKKKKEHSEEWKERVKSVHTIKKKKQKKRSENINERIQQKKQRRIEKREKKLLRPGFEGRKDGYVNE